MRIQEAVNEVAGVRIAEVAEQVELVSKVAEVRHAAHLLINCPNFYYLFF